ncbi:DUF6198 family protein [Lactiplantibacillus plantarum]
MGLLLNSFGVALATKSNLGTTPIAAIPYSLSLIFSLFSMGNWTIIFSVLLVFIQPIVQRKLTHKFQLFLQILVSFAFGYFIDGSMSILKTIYPNNYLVSLLMLLISCIIIALGAYLEVIADIVMLPGDSLVRVLSKVMHHSYGSLRVCSDTLMTLLGGFLCLIFLHDLMSVREGTIIAALLVGNIVKLITAKLNFLPRVILKC